MPLALSYKSVGFEVQELKARDDGWSFSRLRLDVLQHRRGRRRRHARRLQGQSSSRRSPKLLWQHDIAEPLGRVMGLREDDRGLFGEFKISKTARGHDAYQLLKDGALDSMSIGYIPEDQEFADGGIRQLKAVDLLEISVVSIPMNEEALITAVKARMPHPPSRRARDGCGFGYARVDQRRSWPEHHVPEVGPRPQRNWCAWACWSPHERTRFQPTARSTRSNPCSSPSKSTSMVLAEVKANIKDQYDRSAEIERRYDGLITDAEDEHRVKQHLLTRRPADRPREEARGSARAQAPRQLGARGILAAAPSAVRRRPGQRRADQPWRPVHPLGRVRAAAQGRPLRLARSTATTSASS